MPEEEPVVKARDFSEIGLTGLVRDDNYVFEEFLPALQGEKARKIYREMRDNDPVVGSIMFAIEQVIRSVPWTTQQSGTSDKAKQDAEFLQQNMDDMSHTWPDFVAEAMSAVTYGWAFFEIVYKRRRGFNSSNPGKGSRYDDNKVGWRKFAIRSQDSLDSWEFDSTGGIQAMVQRPAPEYTKKTIPIQKGILFRATSTKNNPEGRSALRNAYRPWYFKKRIEEHEGVGLERDLAGLPIAYVDPAVLDPNATDAQKAFLADVLKMVVNVRRDQQEGLVLPAAYDDTGKRLFEFTLLGSPGTRQFSTSEIIGRYNQLIASTVLADFIFLGHGAGSSGSFALASSRTNLFAHAIEAWVSGLEDILNRHIVPRLFRLNGMETEDLPIIKHGDIGTPDLHEIAAFVAQTAGAGMRWFPDERLEKHMRDLARLPEAPPEGIPLQPLEPVPQGRPMQPGEKTEDRMRSPRRGTRYVPRGTPDTPRETQRGI